MAKKLKFNMSNLAERLKSIKAKDIMAKDVLTTKETATLAEVAGLMTKARISGLPVIGKSGKIVGIITATDLFIVMDMIKFGDVVENGMMSVSNPTVKMVMSTDVIKIRKDTTLEEIITIMRYRNRYTLPVFQANKMVGIIGRHDVFKNFYAVVKDLYL